MLVSFSKYAGCGNDFIFIDNRDRTFNYDKKTIAALCHRKNGIGADGMIFLENGTQAPYKMRIFNADGGEAEMCGNGLRCFKLFLEELGIHDNPVRVQTHERLLELTKVGLEVKATMGPPVDLNFNQALGPNLSVDYINTGVPHAVLFVDQLDEVDVEKMGPQIRHHPHFHPKGANANFAEVVGQQEVKVRTFERGVEAETLACGTGATAVAIISALKQGIKPPIVMITKSGERLTIDFKIQNKQVHDVTQQGPAHLIFKGEFKRTFCHNCH